ncbi:carbohydrate-binding protein [Streptomyces sp. L7]
MKRDKNLAWGLSLALAVPLAGLTGATAHAATTDYQAEDATVVQGTVATNHTGYTGTGFVDYTNVTGSYVEFTVSAAATGTASVALRYANGTAVDRPLDISVNGTVVAPAVSFPATADWNAWATKTVNVPLTAGTDKIGRPRPPRTAAPTSTASASAPRPTHKPRPAPASRVAPTSARTASR